MCRLGVVLRHPGAVGVAEPQGVLHGGVPLDGGRTEPLRRLGIVLRHPGAVEVADPEDVGNFYEPRA